MKREITTFKNLLLVWKGYHHTTKMGNNVFEFVAINVTNYGRHFFTQTNSAASYSLQNSNIGDIIEVDCYFRKDKLIATKIEVTKKATIY